LPAATNPLNETSFGLEETLSRGNADLVEAEPSRLGLKVSRPETLDPDSRAARRVESGAGSAWLAAR
jgi:hypothetical protein